jgi:hypothetical protein
MGILLPQILEQNYATRKPNYFNAPPTPFLGGAMNFGDGVRAAGVREATTYMAVAG